MKHNSAVVLFFAFFLSPSTIWAITSSIEAAHGAPSSEPPHFQIPAAVPPLLILIPPPQIVIVPPSEPSPPTLASQSPIESEIWHHDASSMHDTTASSSAQAEAQTENTPPVIPSFEWPVINVFTLETIFREWLNVTPEESARLAFMFNQGIHSMRATPRIASFALYYLRRFLNTNPQTRINEPQTEQRRREYILAAVRLAAKFCEDSPLLSTLTPIFPVDMHQINTVERCIMDSLEYHLIPEESFMRSLLDIIAEIQRRSPPSEPIAEIQENWPPIPVALLQSLIQSWLLEDSSLPNPPRILFGAPPEGILLPQFIDGLMQLFTHTRTDHRYLIHMMVLLNQLRHRYRLSEGMIYRSLLACAFVVISNYGRVNFSSLRLALITSLEEDDVIVLQRIVYYAHPRSIFQRQVDEIWHLLQNLNQPPQTQQ